MESYFKDISVGSKAKGRISKWVFQENKVRQIFRKANISYPLIGTRRCAYQWLRDVHFLQNLACFVFLKHPFYDSLFALLPTYYASTFCKLDLTLFQCWTPTLCECCATLKTRLWILFYFQRRINVISTAIHNVETTLIRRWNVGCV